MTGSQKTVENSERDGNIRPPDLPSEKPVNAGQETVRTVRTGHGTTDWFQIGKEVCQGCILSPCLFNFYAEYIMRKAGLEERQPQRKAMPKNAQTYHTPAFISHTNKVMLKILQARL